MESSPVQDSGVSGSPMPSNSSEAARSPKAGAAAEDSVDDSMTLAEKTALWEADPLTAVIVTVTQCSYWSC